MNVIRKEFFNVRAGDAFRVVPLGDIHIGTKACDEKLLERKVAAIAADPSTYWIGMGDYIDGINRSDPRFSPATLAAWMTIADLSDLAAAQVRRFLDIVQPIAAKCLCLVEGNHETAITKHYERNVFGEIAAGIKRMAGWDADRQLTVGYSGWLNLAFYRSDQRERVERIAFKLHHGHGGGRLAGGPALTMERELWTHGADVVLMGHNHRTAVQATQVEELDNADQVIYANRFGCYTGTFLRSRTEGATTYSEAKGYLPLSLGGVELELRPHAQRSERIKPSMWIE